ncbi:MAG TPA: hypothetical protein VGD39_12305 [Nocardioides sp.]
MNEDQNAVATMETILRNHPGSLQVSYNPKRETYWAHHLHQHKITSKSGPTLGVVLNEVLGELAYPTRISGGTS